MFEVLSKTIGGTKNRIEYKSIVQSTKMAWYAYKIQWRVHIYYADDLIAVGIYQTHQIQCIYIFIYIYTLLCLKYINDVLKIKKTLKIIT